MDVKIISIIPDNRIQAANVMVDITIGDYLKVAKSIIDDNEYQRKKVIKSKIREILMEDLVRGCSIPPIVLSIKNDNLPTEFNYKNFDNNEIIFQAFSANDLVIIDGLQRTHVMLMLEEEIRKNISNPTLFDVSSDSNENKKQTVDLSEFYSRKIRCEVYVGLNRMGILYRMITLNTGQTTMSTRHLMEILYFDYQESGIDGIKLISEKNEKQIHANTIEYRFKDLLDGFNSYLERNENLIERSEILDNIRILNSLSSEESEFVKRDLFKSFVITYKAFLDFIIIRTGKITFNSSDFQTKEYEIKSEPFGNSALDIFKRSQACSGFGAALGFLKTRNIGMQNVESLIPQISNTDFDFTISLKLIVKFMDVIKEKSKKIGNDQRFFFRYIFQFLFDEKSETYLKLDSSVTAAFDEVRTRRLS